MKFNASCTVALVVFTVLAALGQRPANATDRSANLGTFEFAGDSIDLPLSGRGIHPIVAVDIGIDEVMPFVVDTGASINVIDTAIANELNLEVIGNIEIGAPGGPKIPADIVKVPLFRVGNAIIRDAEFVTQDIASFSGGLMQGVLGLGLFRDYLLTFDHSSGYIRVSRDTLAVGGVGVLSYADPDAHIQIDVDVDGTPMSAHADTGSMGKFVLPGELAKSLSLREPAKSGGIARVVGGDRDISFAQLQGHIGFADLKFDDPNVSFITPSFGHGNIGSGILSELIVSVDQKHKLISFRHPTVKRAARKTTNSNSRQIGIQLRGVPGGNVLNIATVIPGTLGEQAGFKSGDAITSLNDKDIEEYEMADLAKLLGGNDPLTFQIQRDGQSKTIAIS